MIRILPLQVNKILQKQIRKTVLKKRNFITICRLHLNLHLLFYISNGILVWNSNSVNRLLQLQQTADIVCAQNNIQLNILFTWNQVQYIIRPYILAHTYLSIHSDYLSSDTIFRAQTSKPLDVSILSTHAVSVYIFFFSFFTMINTA